MKKTFAQFVKKQDGSISTPMIFLPALLFLGVAVINIVIYHLFS